MANGLLGFLGDVGKGLLEGVAETGAKFAATQGNPALLNALQQQKQQQNLLQQLQTMSKEEMEGPFGKTLQRQLQFGDLQGAQKTLINIPRYKEMQSTLQNPKLGLSEETQAAISSITAMDPDLGARALQQSLYLESQGRKQERVLEKTFEKRAALEEKKLAREEAKLPGNIVARAIEEGQVTADDIPGIVGVLQGAGVKLPANESEARIFASRILNSPKVKKLVPAKEQKGWMDSVKEFFTRPRQQSPTPMATPVPQQKVLQFDPKTGTLK